MEEELIVKRLKNVDRELHLVMDELERKEPKKAMSLSELNELMEKERLLDVDTTKLIRKMREKEYGL